MKPRAWATSQLLCTVKQSRAEGRSHSKHQVRISTSHVAFVFLAVAAVITDSISSGPTMCQALCPVLCTLFFSDAVIVECLDLHIMLS